MQRLPSFPLPSTSSTRKVEYRTITSIFGNGYQQDMPDGINDEIVVWNLSYENINKQERDLIINVLKKAKAWDLIAWVDTDNILRVYKMTPEGYSESRQAAVYSLSFTLKSMPGQIIEAADRFSVEFNFNYAPQQPQEFEFNLIGEV